jgi:PAS domain S-box-containing protein
MREPWSPGAIAAMRERLDLPFVRADQDGVVVEFNPRFSQVYGWDKALLGSSILAILPSEYHALHNGGFARFQITEQSQIVNHPMVLATICADGSSVRSEHYIVAEKDAQIGWCFAATLRPLEGPFA